MVTVLATIIISILQAKLFVNIIYSVLSYFKVILGSIINCKAKGNLLLQLFLSLFIVDWEVPCDNIKL